MKITFNIFQVYIFQRKQTIPDSKPSYENIHTFGDIFMPCELSDMTWLIEKEYDKIKIKSVRVKYFYWNSVSFNRSWENIIEVG